MSEDLFKLSHVELLARCRDLELIVEELRSLGERQRQQIQQQAEQLQQLQRKLAQRSKNSSNSSKPPSSDIVKPPASRGTEGGTEGRDGKRRAGGQPGHAMHERALFGPEQVHATQVHTLAVCPCCGGEVEPSDNAPHVLQKIELTAEVPWTVTQHEAHAGCCVRCGQVHYAALPPQVENGGMLGPRLLARIAYLKAVHHASFATIRKYFRDVLGLSISRGRLAKAVAQVSAALGPAHQELREQLVSQPSLRVDETGHKDRGLRHWTWCFRAPAFTWFHIDRSRSSQVLLDVLGEQFRGVLSCDYFSAYRKYMGECDVLVQFCLAHLIRDLKYLTTLPEPDTAAYGRRLLNHLRRLFHAIHQDQGCDPAALRQRLEHLSGKTLRAATARVPAGREAQAIARRFGQHGRAYFQFITTPGVEPTNNLAEQALRFVVIDRHITQGTRSPTGQRWCERIWTVLATCTQQARDALQFLTDTTTAWVHGQTPPSLLPIPAGSSP